MSQIRDHSRISCSGSERSSRSGDICAGIICQGSYAAVPQEENWWFVDPGSSLDSDSEAPDDDSIVKKFRSRAAGHELDFYTCVSLSLAERPAGACLSKRSWVHVRSRVPVLVALQIIVPACLAFYQTSIIMTSLRQESIDWRFRIVGFVLYLYSVRCIHDNSDDECRTLFLKVAHEHKLPVRYILPALFGEIVNACCGIVLVYTLLTVFIISPDPFALVINCMGVNYLGDVDNDFADGTAKDDAIADFDALVHEHGLSSKSEVGVNDGEKYLVASIPQFSYDLFYNMTMRLVGCVRFCGMLVLGHILGIVFLINGEIFPCKALKIEQIWPLMCGRELDANSTSILDGALTAA